MNTGKILIYGLAGPGQTPKKHILNLMAPAPLIYYFPLILKLLALMWKVARPEGAQMPDSANFIYHFPHILRFLAPIWKLDRSKGFPDGAWWAKSIYYFPHILKSLAPIWKLERPKGLSDGAWCGQKHILFSTYIRIFGPNMEVGEAQRPPSRGPMGPKAYIIFRLY